MTPTDPAGLAELAVVPLGPGQVRQRQVFPALAVGGFQVLPQRLPSRRGMRAPGVALCGWSGYRGQHANCEELQTCTIVTRDVEILARSAGIPLGAYPVSRMVNTPRADGKELIKPVA